jgi:hypothetical protein
MGNISWLLDRCLTYALLQRTPPKYPQRRRIRITKVHCRPIFLSSLKLVPKLLPHPRKQMSDNSDNGFLSSLPLNVSTLCVTLVQLVSSGVGGGGGAKCNDSKRNGHLYLLLFHDSSSPRATMDGEHMAAQCQQTFDNCWKNCVRQTRAFSAACMLCRAGKTPPACFGSGGRVLILFSSCIWAEEGKGKSCMFDRR